MSVIIDVRNLCFRYRESERYALQDVTLSVEQGELFAIVGRNGAGKSTLCDALVGLVPHYFTGRMKGEVAVAGMDVSSTSIGELSRLVGLVFQNPFNQLSYTAGTVAEELAYGLANRGVSREEMLKRVRRIAELMRIDHILDRNPLELSGGQVQRVALGSALITNPRVLVLDECTTQLDPLGGREVFDIVKNLNANGVTVIMADHDMERVSCYADHVAVLDQGRLVSVGTPREVFSDPSLAAHGIDAPVYAQLSRSLSRAFGCDVPIAVNEDESVAQIGKVTA